MPPLSLLEVELNRIAQSRHIAAALLMAVGLASNAEVKTWYTLDDYNKCVNLGSPADKLRQLAAQGIIATPSDNYRDGVVAVKYKTANGIEKGTFYYPTKALCDEMARI